MKPLKNLISILFLGIWTLCNAQHEDFNLPLQNPDTVKMELQELFKELSIKHPGFYRYNQKEAFEAYIDSVTGTIQEPINELAILRKAKPIIAKIGCLHTGIHLSEDTEKRLNETPNCFPLALHYDAGSVRVWKKFQEGNSIQIGDEIKSINGRDIQEIYQILLDNIPMDGYNTTGKYKLLQYTFSSWYRNSIEVADEFKIELADGEEYLLKAVKHDQTLSYADVGDKPMSMQVVDGIAIIKIPSFANSILASHDQKFKKEIDGYLDQINDSGIDKLLFDLRGNTGGSDSNPAWLTSFFFDKPYRYWNRIEITEAIAKDVSGMSKVFYGKPRYENGLWLWSDKGLSSKEFQFTNIQKPAKSMFKGEVYILTDGMCLSSCADFTAIMQANQKAIIIGEETGGGYQGNTSGLIPSAELSSGLVVDIPLLKYVNEVPKEKNMGRGTIPDIELRPTLEEVITDGMYLQRVIERIKTK